MSKELEQAGSGPAQPARRKFLNTVALSAVVVPLAGMGMMRGANAAGLPHLKPSDPTAKALSYVEDATASKSPTYKKGDACDVCALYQGDRKAAWGPCAVFPGKDVDAKGWCTSFVKMS